MVVKKDGRREPFNRDKILSGIRRACQKRPVSSAAVEEFVDALEQELQEWPQKEIPSHEIGEKVIKKLREWDDVAYVRFASVYRQFKDITEFLQELTDLLDYKKKITQGDGGERENR
jgi:transcriptional repressor NrdR